MTNKKQNKHGFMLSASRRDMVSFKGQGV